jgi:uncharacterized protein (TIGR02594 family)
MILVQLVVAFRRLLHVVALALCSMAIFAIASPASARSHHGAGRHARAYHAGHHMRRHHVRHHDRHVVRASRWERGVAQMQARGFADAQASFGSNAVPGEVATYGGLASPNVVTETSRYRHVTRASRREHGMMRMSARGLADTQASVESNPAAAATATPGISGSSNVVAEARRYIGGNPTGRGSLWCARFMNMVLQHSGYHGTGSDMARSFASYGQRVSGPQVGAIAVMGRRGGGHVGVVSGIDGAGNPIVVSGNNGNRVREAPISRGRIYAYVMPTG